MLPDVMRYFLSGRWALLLAVPFGFAALARHAGPDGRPALLKKYLLLCALLLLPFVFSFLRRDRAFERIFVNLAPVAALFLALHCSLALGFLLKARKTIGLAVIAGIWAYCAAQFATEVARKDRFLLEKVNSPASERRWDTLYGAYYQAGYRPREIVRLTGSMVAQHPTPLPVFLAGGIHEGAVPFELLFGAGVDYRGLRRTEPETTPRSTRPSSSSPTRGSSSAS